ncbi:MAG: CBS domain-containing protein [Acidimicrobiales bacterium]
MQVSTLITQKGSEVATIRGDATVAAVVAELARHRIGALVVSSDGSHIEGIISERDVVRGLGQRSGGLLEQPVTSIMSATVHTCSPNDDVETLMTTMTNRRIRHLPVIRDGRLCGIVSIGDIVKSRIVELEKDRDELVDYINAR